MDRAPAHYNPLPMFGLRVPTDEDLYDSLSAPDGWCVDCGDEFHLDDCGGYNPPCECGLHCRSCHEAEVMGDIDVYGDDDYDDFDLFPEESA